MTFSTHKQKASKKSSFWGYNVYNLYAVYVSLRRYDFIVKVIDNGRREVKNSLVLEITDATCPRKT